jgi:serine/threonine-protein kinase HipA
MRIANTYVHNIKAGQLIEDDLGKYSFVYEDNYNLEPVSLTMPVSQKKYYFESFPPFFEGLLPEGIMLEGLLKINKLDKKDFFSQLIAVGNDMIGAVTVKLSENE